MLGYRMKCLRFTIPPPFQRATEVSPIGGWFSARIEASVGANPRERARERNKQEGRRRRRQQRRCPGKPQFTRPVFRVIINIKEPWSSYRSSPYPSRSQHPRRNPEAIYPDTTNFLPFIGWAVFSLFEPLVSSLVLSARRFGHSWILDRRSRLRSSTRSRLNETIGQRTDHLNQKEEKRREEKSGKQGEKTTIEYYREYFEQSWQTGERTLFFHPVLSLSLSPLRPSKFSFCAFLALSSLDYSDPRLTHSIPLVRNMHTRGGFLSDSWSIIIGLVFVVLASLVAWFFAPKGENNT
jgi:hypothetical protein